MKLTRRGLLRRMLGVPAAFAFGALACSAAKAGVPVDPQAKAVALIRKCVAEIEKNAEPYYGAFVDPWIKNGEYGWVMMPGPVRGVFVKYRSLGPSRMVIRRILEPEPIMKRLIARRRVMWTGGNQA